ncbi:amine oxidase [Acrocarpospora phusangensis]|uniref:Amine oxidase n=1 Tax=Acrocarpospora phusangensis TaxID=1070424 RepID=A0A919ULW5_9ACTN|nr:FAD-dependent oxidoreductase [Acrocarpospora phusangensis]GIH26389.1 amine oxidase [Acrocarpospora phusangensis]
MRGTAAVIGSGVAGLTAAYVLSRDRDVTLFEADGRLGGHAHTHDVAGLAVDTGFIVHNDRTYPLLTRLFAELGVATQPSEMSMSVRCDGCGLEYAGGKGGAGLFARPPRPGYLRMLAEVPKFHRTARRLLADGDDRPLAEVAGSFSAYFTAHFLTPLVAAVWSCPPALTGRYPARYLFRFLDNHGMLAVKGSPRWRTVAGGSRTYVERAAKGLAVRTSTPVRALTRHPDGVEIRDDGDEVHRFDAAVVATHPDQALRLLAEPTAGERAVLGAFRYARNPATLHTDTAVLPRARAALASWNYRMPGCAADAGGARISYDLTRLQRLETGERYLVTLGEEIADEHAIARMVYEHPVYTPESVAAQARLPGLSTGRVAFAGAYHGWGFHEDGCRSGVRAARTLGSRW